MFILGTLTGMSIMLMIGRPEALRRFIVKEVIRKELVPCKPCEPCREAEVPRDGLPNYWGNLPYTQGSMDNEKMYQELAVSKGFAHWESGPKEEGSDCIGDWFVWNDSPQKFVRVRTYLKE